jgi:hypothetical protein
MLVAEVVENGDSGCIESYTKEFRAVFLFEFVTRYAPALNRLLLHYETNPLVQKRNTRHRGRRKWE